MPFDKLNFNYYVLLTPNSAGICKGLYCDGDEVFFFEEFRDDVAATSFGRRKIATAKATRTAANIQTKAAPKVIDTSIAQITEEKLSYKKISALIKIYLITSESILLRDCKRLLESKGTDNAERNSHLHNFLRCDEAVGKETAEEVKADIEVIFCELARHSMLTSFPGDMATVESSGHYANRTHCFVVGYRCERPRSSLPIRPRIPGRSSQTATQGA
jgi:hypothetical protein